MKNLKVLVASMALMATSAVFAGQEISGKQLLLKDSTVGVSGLWNWVTASDNLNIGTEIVPARGTSPLFAKEDGSILAEAYMKIGPEPEWTQEKADAGLLKYPVANIQVHFKSDECVKDSSCGVDFAKLGIKYIRVTQKSSGPMRLAILNTLTDEYKKKHKDEEGAEPGIGIWTSSDYTTTIYDLTPCDMGFLGRGKDCSSSNPDSLIDVFDWVDPLQAPDGNKILNFITGLKWEIREPRGGTGEISIKSIEFLNAQKEVVKTSLLTGVTVTRSNINDPLFTVIASGKQQALQDTTVGVSGLWNWIASHDYLDIGTEMVPDSGTSPLFAKEDGSIFAEAYMKIGPEPEWTQEKADAGLLKYPSAYIEMKFKKEECVQDSSCGVDFSALGIKYVRVRSKVSGRIRMSVLNEKTIEKDAEPGVYIPNSSGYQTTTYDLTPFEFGFKGFDDHNYGGIFDWVDYNKAPEGAEIIKCVTGLKWEIREPRGGTGEISIMSIEFLDKDQNVVDAVKLTGVTGVRSVIESSSSAEPESSSSEEPESSSSVEPESSSSEEPESSSSVEPESSSSEEPESSSSEEPESSSSAEPESSSSEEPKSSSSVAPKSSSSSSPKSSSSAPKSSSSSSKKKDAIQQMFVASTVHVAVSGNQVLISNATLGSDYAVFSMQGKVVATGKIHNGTESVTLSNQGAYLIRVGREIFKVNRK